jgi:hypothetical protein
LQNYKQNDYHNIFLFMFGCINRYILLLYHYCAVAASATAFLSRSSPFSLHLSGQPQGPSFKCPYLLNRAS